MLYHIFIFLTVLELVSCKKAKVSPVSSQPIADIDRLKEKHRSYILWTDEVRDDYGFVRNCDSLLFTALGNVGGTRYDLSIAEGSDESGQPNALWYRTPSHDCYSGDGPGSDISKDMFLGLIWESYRGANLSRLRRIRDYGSEHSWIMGRGDSGAVVLTPSLVSTLTEAIYHLDGPNHQEERLYPQSWPDGLRGYEFHLQTVHILLRGEILGSIDKTMFQRIEEHHLRNPRNALLDYSYHLFTDGNYDSTVRLLLDDPVNPNDRLPSGKDRCQSYVYQREDYEYVPCEEDHPERDEIYDGSDFIFVAGLVIGEDGRKR